MAGCSTSPLARHPDFIERKKNFPPAIVMTDFIIIDAPAGDTSKVDLVENLSEAKMCLNLFAGNLNERGYRVDRTLISSIGLLMNRNQPYKVVQTVEDQQVAERELSTRNPPFFIHAIYAKDVTLLEKLSTIYTMLINSHERKGESPLMIPEAIEVGKAMGGGTLVIALVGGYNVPITSQIGKETSSQSLTRGIVTTQHVTQLSMAFYMIDASSGLVIWDDRRYVKGGIIHKQKIVDMIESLIVGLP